MKPAEAYILKQDEPYRSILLHLQAIITYTFPKAELKYKWHLPCYYLDGRPICYLNQTKNYVDMGFWHTAHLTMHTEFLVADKRKVVRSLRYKTVEAINEEVAVAVLKAVATHKNKSYLK